MISKKLLIMKQLVLLLAILLIQFGYSKDVAENLVEKDCVVQDEQRFNFPEHTEEELSIFLSDNDTIIIQVAFKDHDENQDNDLLILKHSSGIIQKKRHGEAVRKDIIPQIDIPVGWNKLNFKIKDLSLHVGKFYTDIAFEYPISYLLITAKYLTYCPNGTPKWKIKQGSAITIPLDGLTNAAINLTSEELFLVELTIKSHNNEFVIRPDSNLLPSQKYFIELVRNNTSTISIRNAGEKSNLLLNAFMNDEFESLTVTSHKGNIDIILDLQNVKARNVEKALNTPPTPNNEVNCTDRKDESSYHQSDPPDRHNSPNNCTSNNLCRTCWIILALFGLLLLIILIVYCVSRFKKNKPKISDEEEAEEKIPLLEEAKYKVKSENTEKHGELNQQLYPHQKEICKLQLKSDNNYANKKMLGELDGTKRTRVILAVGQTGSGKSSVLNAMTNFIYKIAFDDPFRFKLVADVDLCHKSGTNTTEEITSYYLPFTPGIAYDSNYILIDTPGFGDFRGIDEDKKLITKFYNFLKKNQDITEVDAICFVIKASDTRLTHIQNYIINGLFSMFGKDVKRNINVFVSFSDGTVTHAPKLLNDCGLGFDLEILFNGNGLFNTSEKVESYSKGDIRVQEHFKENWKMTMLNMTTFFQALQKKLPVNLSLTNVVLEENEDINQLKDDLLKLIAKEDISSDKEKLNIQSRIEQNQNLLMSKVEEAKKLFSRLKKIPCKENPLVVNDYIDTLIIREKNENKIRNMEKLKERNTLFQTLLEGKESNKFDFKSYFFGEKNVKTD